MCDDMSKEIRAFSEVLVALLLDLHIHIFSKYFRNVKAIRWRLLSPVLFSARIIIHVKQAGHVLPVLHALHRYGTAAHRHFQPMEKDRLSPPYP